jgi:serine/threonine-protein kinase 24/25/MST4
VRNSEMWENNGTIRSDWNFDTVHTNSAMGTFRSIAKDLLPPGMEEDEDYVEDDASVVDEGKHASIDTAKGSGPITSADAIGSNMQAAHSTIIIRPAPEEPDERDLPSLLASDEMGSSAEDGTGPATSSRLSGSPPLGAPPAYTGSMRSGRRSSYAERNDMRGTLMREADLGTGIDTIRPVKKVDTVGSLRLSADFVGSARKDGSTSVPTSPTKNSNKRGPTELAKAGTSMVEEVVLPILQNVRILFWGLNFWQGLNLGCNRRFEMTWTPEKLNH